MSEVVFAEYDGKVFVPKQPVNLPPGTWVQVVYAIPPSSESMESPPSNSQPVANEEERIWKQLVDEWASADWPEKTLEECMRRIRGPSWS